jgi:hypothetical protein
VYRASGSCRSARQGLADQLQGLADQLGSCRSAKGLADQLQGLADQLQGLADQLGSCRSAKGLADQFQGLADQLQGLADQLPSTAFNLQLSDIVKLHIVVVVCFQRWLSCPKFKLSNQD